MSKNDDKLFTSHEHALEKEYEICPECGADNIEIDIDIILCRECALDGADLQIPHKKFAGRRFVLAPLAEIEKHLYIESTNRTITDLLNRCPDQSYIQKLATNW